MADDIWRLSAVELAGLIAARKLSAVEAVTAAVERMRAANPAVNAVTVDLGDEAIETARRLDRLAAETEVALGPLHGVPVTIKENIDVRGQATPNGLPGLADLIAPDDSPVTRNLRQAGAVIIGRTNTPEFSYRFFTDNPLRGKTLNPWDESLTPGGSSGGAGAAAALGFGPIHHGNDLGGSLRYPAYCCGVATVRPTLGRVPAFNPSAPEERPPLLTIMSVQGTIAREVRDVRLGTAVMAGRDARDPWWVPAPLEGSVPARPIRVALTKAPAGFDIDPDVAAAVDQAARWLEDAGYRVEEREPPFVTDVQALWRDLLMTETEALTRPSIDRLGSEAIQSIMSSMRQVSTLRDLEGYLRGVADRARLLRAWMLFFEETPLLISPLSLQKPFRQDLDLEGPQAMASILDANIHMSNMNFLGLPAAVVPVALAGSAPVGVQLVAGRYREDLCLDAAAAIEARAGLMAKRLWERAG